MRMIFDLNNTKWLTPYRHYLTKAQQQKIHQINVKFSYMCIHIYSDIGADFLSDIPLCWHSIWHCFWNRFWHSICHSISHMFWKSIWHTFWHSIWHSFRHMLWHTIWHAWPFHPQKAATPSSFDPLRRNRLDHKLWGWLGRLGLGLCLAKLPENPWSCRQHHLF